MSGFSREVSQRARSRRVARRPAVSRGGRKRGTAGVDDLARLVEEVPAGQDPHRLRLLGHGHERRGHGREQGLLRELGRAQTLRSSRSSGAARRQKPGQARVLFLAAFGRGERGDGLDLRARLRARGGGHGPLVRGARQLEAAEGLEAARVLMKHQREGGLVGGAQRFRELHHEPMVLAVGHGQGEAARVRPPVDDPRHGPTDEVAFRRANGFPAASRTSISVTSKPPSGSRPGPPLGSSSKVNASSRSALRPFTSVLKRTV